MNDIWQSAKYAHKPNPVHDTHVQRITEGATGQRRASTLWKLSKACWGWGRDSLPIQAQRPDKHTRELMSSDTETYSISERAEISIQFYSQVKYHSRTSTQHTLLCNGLRVYVLHI